MEAPPAMRTLPMGENRFVAMDRVLEARAGLSQRQEVLGEPNLCERQAERATDDPAQALRYSQAQQVSGHGAVRATLQKVDAARARVCEATERATSILRRENPNAVLNQRHSLRCKHHFIAHVQRAIVGRAEFMRTYPPWHKLLSKRLVAQLPAIVGLQAFEELRVGAHADEPVSPGSRASALTIDAEERFGST